MIINFFFQFPVTVSLLWFPAMEFKCEKCGLMYKYHYIICVGVCVYECDECMTLMCYIRYKRVPHGKAAHNVNSLKCKVLLRILVPISDLIFFSIIVFIFHFYQMTLENPVTVFWFH